MFIAWIQNYVKWSYHWHMVAHKIYYNYIGANLYGGWLNVSFNVKQPIISLMILRVGTTPKSSASMVRSSIASNRNSWFFLCFSTPKTQSIGGMSVWSPQRIFNVPPIHYKFPKGNGWVVPRGFSRC